MKKIKISVWVNEHIINLIVTIIGVVLMVALAVYVLNNSDLKVNFAEPAFHPPLLSVGLIVAFIIMFLVLYFKFSNEKNKDKRMG